MQRRCGVALARGGCLNARRPCCLHGAGFFTHFFRRPSPVNSPLTSTSQNHARVVRSLNMRSHRPRHVGNDYYHSKDRPEEITLEEMCVYGGVCCSFCCQPQPPPARLAHSSSARSTSAHFPKCILQGGGGSLARHPTGWQHQKGVARAPLAARKVKQQKEMKNSFDL